MSAVLLIFFLYDLKVEKKRRRRKQNMKKSRKIAIFCSHYYPYLGGVENYTAHLAGELKKGEIVW